VVVALPGQLSTPTPRVKSSPRSSAVLRIAASTFFSNFSISESPSLKLEVTGAVVVVVVLFNSASCSSRRIPDDAILVLAEAPFCGDAKLDSSWSTDNDADAVGVEGPTE
jgi:hypothetical protein